MAVECSLDNILADKFLLTDGATGTNLFSKWLTAEDAPELWNIEHNKKIAELHTDFLEAGSHLLLQTLLEDQVVD